MTDGRLYHTLAGMKTTLSAKRQVSLPKELCDQLNLQPGAQIVWEVERGRLIGHPLPQDGWRALIGRHKHGSKGTVALLAQRREDRRRENRKLDR